MHLTRLWPRAALALGGLLALLLLVADQPEETPEEVEINDGSGSASRPFDPDRLLPEPIPPLAQDDLPAAQAGRLPELKTLHVVLALDTETSIQEAVRLDGLHVLTLLCSALPPDRCAVTVFAGPDRTRSALLAHFGQAKIDPDTGVLFYFSGHAGTDARLGDHRLQMNNGPDLFRPELRRAIEARKPGLVVLLTDCSSTVTRGKPGGEGERPAAEGKVAVPEGRPFALKSRRTTIHPTFQGLFYQARGTVDIIATDRSNAWGDDDEGGLFTRVFRRTLEKPFKKLDTDGDGRLTWKEFFPTLQAETESAFKAWAQKMRSAGEVITDETQRPHAFSLGTGPVAPQDDEGE